MTERNDRPSIILGIETSCDETGLALYDTRKGLLTEALSSQIEIHAQYGGVVPEIASRDHILKISFLLRQIFEKSKIHFRETTLIAYTRGPGLAGSLLVGAAFAQGLAWSHQKPLIGVHHLEAHLLSPLLNNPELHFPYIGALLSGGHTQIFSAKGPGRYDLLGETQDDAIGEAFDKTAKLLELGYPGGPALAQLAQKFSHQTHASISLPRPMYHSPDLNMSFSGIKTAVRRFIEKNGQPLSLSQKIALAHAFEEAVTDTIIEKIRRSCVTTGHTHFALSGGVSANIRLREKANALAQKNNWHCFYPSVAVCTDNGVMVAHVAAQKLLHNPSLLERKKPLLPLVLPRWPLAHVREEGGT